MIGLSQLTYTSARCPWTDAGPNVRLGFMVYEHEEPDCASSLCGIPAVVDRSREDWEYEE